MTLTEPSGSTAPGSYESGSPSIARIGLGAGLDGHRHEPVVRTVTGTAVLDQLEPRGNRRVAGHRAAVYRGTLDGVSTELGWIAELQLPARVERRVGDDRQELRLTGLEQGEAAAMRFMTREQLQAYESIDFADLGDRHGDPFVERVMNHGGLQLHTH